MKKILLLSYLISFFKLSAQEADLATHNAVNDSLVALFNRQAFQESYSLLSPNLQKQLPQNNWVSLLKVNMYAGLGKVIRSEYFQYSKGAHLYKWFFDKITIQTSLVVHQSRLIEGVYFKPFVDKALKRTQRAATDNPLKTDLDKTIDSLARTYIDNVHTAGLSIGVIKDGRFFTYHYGETQKNTSKLPDNKTLYEIGSITKTFTGLLLAKTVLKKKIRLDDDIRQYLPEKYPNLVFKGQPILIKHLTNHTARLRSFPVEDITAQKGYNAQNPYKHYNSDMVLAYLHKITLDTVAGIQSEYSNFASGLMGIILEKKMKNTYENLIKKFITTPLSMTDTKIILTKEDSSHLAKPYDADGNPTHYWDITGLAGAGAIRSTLNDMLKYAKANLEAKDKAVILSHQPTFKVNSNSEIGLFWQLSTTKNGQQIIWHNGGTGGFSSFCGMIKAKNLAVIMLSNCSETVTQKGMDLIKIIQQ